MISIVTPVYNEGERIRDCLEKLIKKLNSFDEEWELIIVNDGSTDNSIQEINRVAKANEKIRVISYKINRGRGYALRKGFEAAVGDYIVTTESDFSWGITIIERMLNVLKDNGEYDMVIASPHLHDNGYINVPKYRVYLSKIGNKLLKLAFGGKITMATGMTRAYKREVVKLLLLECEGKEIHLEILSKALALGYKIIEIPAVIEWPLEKRKRDKKTSKLIKIIFFHLIFCFHEAPILLFGLLSLFFLITSLLFFLVSIIFKALMHFYIPLGLILFLMGSQFIVLTFISYQVRKVQVDIVRLNRELVKAHKSGIN